ncbi:MAG TPA: serine/threonine-protein kinase [Tepidisphaeraceae bacterium]|nr:serine/threonine-protein kinase [Tepidisphaeraceae bacterium]
MGETTCMAQKFLHYDVLERLGEGARSVIYLVQDPTTRQVFALKHVVRQGPKDLRFIQQMETEYEISRQFNHPYLRRSYELKIIKTMLVKVSEAFLVMELVDGKPLDARPPTDMMDVCDIFIHAAEGLRAMHQMGYVHCDIKPNNILVNDHGGVKVIDFGQSCKIGTIKERIQGTPDFIAPEQVSRRPMSVQTDVFNLGATLYWVLTGKHIPTLYTVNKKGENSFLLDTRFDSPLDLNPKVPPALSNLAMECVATRPQKRPADMDEVIQRLELGKHIAAKQSPTVESAPESAIPPSTMDNPG